MFLFEIGFLPVRIWDLLDILIVGYLMYQIYKLLKGNIAFNIFVGVLTLYVVWWLVNQLQMDLLAVVLDQFVSVGVIIIIIIFQPEIRRFLLVLGNTTIRQRYNFLSRILDRNFEDSEGRSHHIRAIKSAIVRMSGQKTGALIILAGKVSLDGLATEGVRVDAEISEPLLESIFTKESPLHDGAVILSGNSIKSASCILPVSEKPSLPKSMGLRHRAAVGITERTNVAAFIVSEETGRISFAHQGQLRRGLRAEDVEALLNEHF